MDAYNPHLAVCNTWLAVTHSFRSRSYKKNTSIFQSLRLWEKVCKVTLPCLLVASAPQIDLQAFIKAASGRAGLRNLGWPAARTCVSTSVWALWTPCDCVRLRRGPRLLPEVEFHSLLFHYSYKATALLRRVQSCKKTKRFISPALLAAFAHPRLLLFSLFNGYSRNGNKHLSNCIHLQSCLVIQL